MRILLPFIILAMASTTLLAQKSGSDYSNREVMDKLLKRAAAYKSLIKMKIELRENIKRMDKLNKRLLEKEKELSELKKFIVEKYIPELDDTLDSIAEIDEEEKTKKESDINEEDLNYLENPDGRFDDHIPDEVEFYFDGEVEDELGKKPNDTLGEKPVEEVGKDVEEKVENEPKKTPNDALEKKPVEEVGKDVATKRESSEELKKKVERKDKRHVKDIPWVEILDNMARSLEAFESPKKKKTGND